jgi:hypothetical protein
MGTNFLIDCGGIQAGACPEKAQIKFQNCPMILRNKSNGLLDLHDALKKRVCPVAQTAGRRAWPACQE